MTLIMLSTFTIYKGYREHHEPRSLILGILGFALLFASLFFAHNQLQIIISVSGSVLMTAAHYTNYKLCKVVEPCCDNTH